MNQNDSAAFFALARKVRRAIRNMAPVAELRMLCGNLACWQRQVDVYVADARRAMEALRMGCDELDRTTQAGEANGPAWDMLRIGARDMVQVAAEHVWWAKARASR